MKKFTNSYLIATIACMGGLYFGFDIASMSAIIDQKPYLSTFNEPDSLTQGGITAAMAGGSFLSSLFAGPVSDKWGRKPVIIASSIIWIVGAIIQAASLTQAQLIVGRVVGGMAVGLASTQVPVFVAELAPVSIRGRLIGGFQWAVTWGILIQFLIGYGCSKIDNNASFQITWAMQIVPGLLLLCGMFFVPESPRWLANKDRWEEAIEIITQVQGKGDVNNPHVLVEIEELKEQVRIDRDAKAISIVDMFRKGSLLRTFIGMCAQMWQQLCGMNVMMYYIVYIFKMSGFEGDTTLVPSIIQYVLNMLMTIPALLYIDKFGRRPVLLIGGCFMAVWLWTMSGLLAVYSEEVPEADRENPNITITIPPTTQGKSASKAVIACCYLFVCSFAPSWGPGIWLYCAEIFPLRQRATGSALCGSMNWAFNFALALFVPSAFHDISWRTYCVFGTFCTVMTIQVFFMFPETNGKTLEEIEQIWAANIPAWKTASFQVRTPSINDIKAVNDVPDHEKGVDAQKEETV